MKFLLTSTALLILFSLNGSALAQSGDRDNPTPLASNIIKGNGIGKKVEYYYSFSAGPGEVVVTIDLKAKSGSTNADVEIFDGESNKIFYYYPGATSTNERGVKKVSVNSKQQLILRLAFDMDAGEYAIKLAGPVELAAPAPTAEAVMSPADSAAAPPPAEDATQPATDTPAPDPATATESSTAKPGKGSKFDLGVNLMQTVGTHFGLPTSGMLHIVMKDGTTQDVDLSKVKSASVQKQ